MLTWWWPRFQTELLSHLACFQCGRNGKTGRAEGAWIGTLCVSVPSLRHCYLIVEYCNKDREMHTMYNNGTKLQRPSMPFKARAIFYFCRSKIVKQGTGISVSPWPYYFSRGSSGGACSPLFFRQNWGLKGCKKFFWDYIRFSYNL